MASALSRMKAPRVLIIIAALILGWQAWLEYQARGKIPSDLPAHMSDRGGVDLRVTLRFPPERFHILTFQKYGRVSGTAGHSVEVRSVPVGLVREIARFYWVREIAILRE